MGTGTTPTTVYRLPDAGPAPVVIVSHGFAGSRPLMQATSLTLASGLDRLGPFDLILCGKQAIDGDTAVVGAIGHGPLGQLVHQVGGALLPPVLHHLIERVYPFAGFDGINVIDHKIYGFFPVEVPDVPEYAYDPKCINFVGIV